MIIMHACSALIAYETGNDESLNDAVLIIYLCYIVSGKTELCVIYDDLGLLLIGNRAVNNVLSCNATCKFEYRACAVGRVSTIMLFEVMFVPICGENCMFIILLFSFTFAYLPMSFEYKASFSYIAQHICKVLR